VAFNLELALDPRAKLASPARKENEGRDENRLSKAQIEGIAELTSDFFNSIGQKAKFGPRGRLSTDLDFTLRSDISDEDLMEMMLDALGQPYHGLSFRFDRDKDWYFTDNSLAANPVCVHAENDKGVKIKLQVSLRERPVLPVHAMTQIAQDYFALLPFKPAGIPSLAYEEVVSEIRAASQRSKIRDLHDLSEVAVRALNRDLIRTLAVIKLWKTVATISITRSSRTGSRTAATTILAS
jgi:predicted nucleotidyltransferase component of viral defense system